MFQNDQTLFKIYRQKGCQFECRLRYAANFTNCIPWDYPVPDDLDGIDICLSERDGRNMLKEFGLKMDDPDALESCDCLPDCEEIKYDTQESAKIRVHSLLFIRDSTVYSYISAML